MGTVETTRTRPPLYLFNRLPGSLELLASNATDPVSLASIGARYDYAPMLALVSAGNT